MIAECSICLKDITQNLITTTCGHKYHLTCLKTWVSQRETCPMCRAYVPAEIEPNVPQADLPTGRILIWHESVRVSAEIWKAANGSEKEIVVITESGSIQPEDRFYHF